jgi:hypothetical protein
MQEEDNARTHGARVIKNAMNPVDVPRSHNFYTTLHRAEYIISSPESARIGLKFSPVHAGRRRSSRRTRGARVTKGAMNPSNSHSYLQHKAVSQPAWPSTALTMQEDHDNARTSEYAGSALANPVDGAHQRFIR